jgi:hypothetical protein
VRIATIPISIRSIREQIQMVAMRFLLDEGIFRWLRFRNRMRIKPHV